MNIPVLSVTGDTLAIAYELALFELYRKGMPIKTQYDKPGDPPSLDATMNMTILYPEQDPMIHKAFPGGIEDLREYVLELQGAKDHWVKNLDDPLDTRWEYTYHGRLAGWGRKKTGGGCSGYADIDQVAVIIDKLCSQPFTRQAQMITWMPDIDNECYDPPCLQSLWYRIVEDESGIWWLNCNVRFRSNDAWGANFMNMFGFVQFNRLEIADKIAARTGKAVKLGRLNWQADSFHIYGKDLTTAKERLFDRVSEPLEGFERRIYNFYDEMIQEIYNEASDKVLEKIKNFDAER